MKDLNDPTNRDSVPAMLTPGEFVLNKEASTMFAPQIEAMNNAGLQQRAVENKNLGGQIPGGYNVGGLVTFLKDKEGWDENAYKDSGGVWTIGYGRTGDDVVEGSTTTRDVENTWLDSRAAEELAAVKAFGKTNGYEWNDGQLNALASFRYNGGQDMLDNLTDFGKRDNDTIQKKFGLYNKITNPDTGKKEFVQGLQNRRDAELGLWGGTTPTETPAAAPLDQAPETTQQLQTDSMIAPGSEVGPDVGGFPSSSDLAGLAGQALQPQQMAPPPMMAAPPPPAAYIPSVTQGNLPTSQAPVPITEESNPMNKNSLWNDGGSVQHFAKGGEVEDKKRKKKNDKDKSSKARGEYKVADWFYEPGADDPLSPLGKDWKWSQKPNYGLSQELQQQVVNAPDTETRKNIATWKDHLTPQARVEEMGGKGYGTQSPHYVDRAKVLELMSSGLSQADAYEAAVGWRDELNDGGSVQHLNRGGRGKEKVWDSATQKYIWVAPSDVRVEQQKALAASAQPTKTVKPMALAAASQPFVGDHGPKQPQAPYVQSPNLPHPGLMQYDRPPNDVGNMIQHDWTKQDFAAGGQGVPRTVPQIPQPLQGNPVSGGVAPTQTQAPTQQPSDLPPVPGSDEALLQGSSQQIEIGELQPVPSMDQNAPPPPPMVPNQAPAGGAVPPAPAQVTDLSGLSEEQIGQLYDQGNPAAIAYAENEDQQQRTTSEIERVRAKQAVTNPQTDGAAVLAAQHTALQNKLSELQATPEGAQVQGAGAVPALGTPEVKVHEQAGDAWAMPTVPEELGEISTGIDPGDLALNPDFGQDPRGQDQRNVPPEVQKATINDTVAKVVASDPEAATTPNEAVHASVAEASKTVQPAQVQEAKGMLSEAFGNLFDGKELARMGLLMAGAMLTGMSPGRALAFAGTNYIQRLDAKENAFGALVKSAKYSPSSLKAYKESGDPSDLVPVGVAPEATGNFKTLYGKGGKKVVVQEMKVGKNTILVDQNGRQVNGYALQENAADVRGTPEWRTRLKATSSAIKDQLKGFRETFDEFETADGTASKTDILPDTAAAKIAEWAADNGVEPDQLGGLVESAYHDAVNDKRQDGGRARNLVPYLNQLVIRQQTGNADAFKTKDGGYIDPAQLKSLNGAASGWLRGKGQKGKTSDLTNLFYNAALEDWNALDAATKKIHENKAPRGTNGFYQFATQWLAKNAQPLKE